MICLAVLGCEPPKPPGVGRIISLSPAATDLILAMGSGDLLAGVSSYETDERVKMLPRVGDYENVDWERIASIRPKVMIVQMRAEKVPPGMYQRAGELGITIKTVQIDTLIDVFTESDLIGRAIGRDEDGRKLSEMLREPFMTGFMGVRDAPPVKTLLVTSDDGLGVAGGRTFLDDVLRASGGINVLGNQLTGYAKIDKESVLSVAPEAIIQLMPAATTEQVASAKAFWATLPELPAVRDGRVYVFTEPWVLRPGSTVIALNKKMIAVLHPEESAGAVGSGQTAGAPAATKEKP